MGLHLPWRFFAVSIWIGRIIQTQSSSVSDPSYDHQTEVYNASFGAMSANGGLEMSAFFGPEHSSDTLVELINEATSMIDISTSSILSWLDECQAQIDENATCAPGCSPSEQRSETFPIFPALLNALHRGLNVRIITNDFGFPDCPGTITMLQFLALNGADVRFYTTTTFTHAKIMSIDNGTQASLSSIYWSEDSFTTQREAGLLLKSSTSFSILPKKEEDEKEGNDQNDKDDGHTLLKYVQAIYEYDFNKAYPLVPGTWSSDDLNIITNSSLLHVLIPPYNPPSGIYISPPPSFQNNSNDTLQTSLHVSPDFAWETLQASLSSVQTKLQAGLFQVTTPALCSELLEMSNAGIDVQLLVSPRVPDITDCRRAQACYAYLYQEGFTTVRKASLNYSHSHQKYWIVDGLTVGISTGNWSPEDNPTDHSSNLYPPFGDPDWVDANRDYTVISSDPYLISSFQTAFDSDYQAPETGYWSPSSPIQCS